jgi:uncharacterized protein with FMN-binding domain
LGTIAVFAIASVSFLITGQDEVENENISGILAQEIADGTYTGSYDGYRWKNTIRATVSGGKITAIDIIEDQAAAIPDVSSRIFERVMQRQTTGVDVVAGATVSSKAYLKALENAFSRAG